MKLTYTAPGMYKIVLDKYCDESYAVTTYRPDGIRIDNLSTFYPAENAARASATHLALLFKAGKIPHCILPAHTHCRYCGTPHREWNAKSDLYLFFAAGCPDCVSMEIEIMDAIQANPPHVVG